MARIEGKCRICKLEGTMDWHHIITQSQCKTNGWDLLLEDKGNLVKLCRRCHRFTTSSIYHYEEAKKDNPRAANFCFKCGRDSHWASSCLVEKDIDGHEIPDDASQGWWWHQKPLRWKKEGKHDIFLRGWDHGLY